MLIREYQPPTPRNRMIHQRMLRRMSRDIIPQNFTLAYLIGIIVIGVIFWMTLAAWATGAIAEEGPTAAPDYRTVNVQADSYLNFRELPSRAAPVVFTLSSGSRVRVLEERNGWSLCVWETLEGLTNPPKAWAKSEYLTK